MKTIFKSFICALALTATLASCVKEADGISEKSYQKMSFTASVDEVDPVNPVRTSLGAGYSVLWTSQDKISVFAAGENKEFVAVNLQEENKKATFEGLAAAAESYYAVYPYNADATINGTTVTTTLPTVQAATAGSFAQAANLSAAKTTDGDLRFLNAGALIGFSVSGNGVTSVSLSSRDGETLMSGAVQIALDGDEPVMTVADGGVKFVKLEGTFEAEKKYYFIVAPGLYKGLTLTFANAETEATCVRQHAGDVQVDRNDNKWLGNFTIADSDWVGASYRSYTFNSKEEVDAFVAAGTEKEVVIDLTLTGSDIDDAEFRALAGRISEIRGTLTIDGIGNPAINDWLHFNQLFGSVKCKGGIIVKNITKAADFRNVWWTTINGDFHIENLADFVCDGWVVNNGSLDNITEIKGNLTVKNVSKMNGNTFINLKKVGGSVTIIGSSAWEFACEADLNDEGRTDPDRLMSIQSIGGDLVLQDNKNLWTLEGFHNLSHLGGNVIITGNGDIPTGTDYRYGFCIFKDYQDLGVLKPGATVLLKNKAGEEIDFAALQGCNPSEYKSYVIEGEQQLLDFIAGKGAEKETVNNLYITGADITSGTFMNIDDRVGAIVGTLTIDAVGTSGMEINTDQSLRYIDIQGSFIMKNITSASINPNGIFPNEGTKITGDFILENCPTFPTDWDPNKGLVEIGGDLIIRGPMRGFGERFFPAIQKIGGDFIVEDVLTNFYSFRVEHLTYIGGDLSITGCAEFGAGEGWGCLYGFHNLTHLGGNVTIIKPYVEGIRHAWLSSNDYNLADRNVGLCIFRGYKETGVMSPDAVIKAVARAGIGNDYNYDMVNEVGICGVPEPEETPAQ